MKSYSLFELDKTNTVRKHWLTLVVNTANTVWGGEGRLDGTTHKLSYGVAQDFVPVIDDALVVVLNEEFNAIPTF